MARHVDFTQVTNFRDAGGYSGQDGCSVVWGQLFRSGHLGQLAGEELDRFNELGITAVIDLRYPWEIERRGRVPEVDGLSYYNLSIEQEPYNQMELGEEIDPVTYLADRYMEVASDGTGEIRQVLEIIASAQGPVVFHCAAGKDRTGIIAALVHSILGVSEEDIIADFALTGLATERLVNTVRARHPEGTYMWQGYGQAPADLMRLFLAKLNAEYGSVHGYLTGTAGLDEAVLVDIRKRLLA